jgi:hypothetical protein
VAVVVVWLPWPDEALDGLDPAACPVPLDFVCPGEDWLTVRPGPDPPARTPLFAFEPPPWAAVTEPPDAPDPAPDPVVAPAEPCPWLCDTGAPLPARAPLPPPLVAVPPPRDPAAAAPAEDAGRSNLDAATD